MEDAGYYCIDNMPPELMSTFVGLLANNSEYYPKVAMVVDVRSGHVFEKIISSIDNVEQYGYTAKIVYLDINDTEALKRYKLTRRKHPFADKFNGNIQNAILQLDNAQVDIRNDLLNCKTKYADVDAQYKLVKTERKALKKQVSTIEKRIKEIDKAKEKIRKNML